MHNPYLLGFRCTTCGTEYSVEATRYTCTKDGGNLDAVYNYAAIAERVNPADMVGVPDRSVWHYAFLLPLSYDSIAPVSARSGPTPLSSLGWSPLYRAPALERGLDIRAIWLKDDGRLPSASFKDRASSMVIARALDMGAEVVVTASTGNAAAALATMSVGTGIQAIVFVPEGTPEGKLAGILIHGATVYAVPGSYDDAVALCSAAAERFGWYNRSTGLNPYTREGKKTAAYEICEQLARMGKGEGGMGRGEWGRGTAQTIPFPISYSPSFRSPDVVIVPVGDGNIISGVHKGFKDLLALGWIERMPRFIGVTASLAPALFQAWQSGTEHITRMPSSTLASGISVDLPNDGIMALRAIRETGGTFIEATDEEMLDAMAVLGRDAGVFVEPACAATYVGLVKARRAGAIGPDDEVVLQLTGSGLKDTQSALRAAGKPRIVRSLDEISA